MSLSSAGRIADGRLVKVTDSDRLLFFSNKGHHSSNATGKFFYKTLLCAAIMSNWIQMSNKSKLCIDKCFDINALINDERSLI